MQEQEEIWKDVPGYEGYYQVSNLARVKSLDRFILLKNGFKRKINERLLIPSKDRDGYLEFSLYKKSKRKHFKSHRLVAILFLENPLNLPQVNHKNKKVWDNNLTNLEWCSQRENDCHKQKTKIKTSKYIGVYYDNSRKKWSSSIFFNNKAINLGRFNSELEAYEKRKDFEIKNKIINKYI